MSRPPMRPRHWATIFATVAALASPGSVGANDLDAFGFGARGQALGSAMTALATGFDATYYNPAGLAIGTESEVTTGFSYAGYRLRFSASGLDEVAERRVERQQPLSAFTLGLRLRLGERGWPGRVGLGLGFFLPTRQFVGTELQTAPGEPQFFLLGARRDKIGVLPAVAIRLLPWEGAEGLRLSLGLGATVLADLQGRLVFNLASGTAVRTELDLSPDVAPNAGLYLAPSDRLSVGITYRGELSLKADLPVVIDLDGDGVSDFPLDLEAVTLFQPQQLALGVAWDPLPELTLSTDWVWLNWSAFRDPFVTIRPVVGQLDPDFHDTFATRVGIEWRASDAVALRLGYGFEPSPIPRQTGETNLIDRDRHVVTFGFGWSWWTERERLYREPPAEDGTPGPIRARTEELRPLSVDLFFQWHHLVAASTTKRGAAASGPVGDRLRAGGEIFNGGIQLTVRF